MKNVFKSIKAKKDNFKDKVQTTIAVAALIHGVASGALRSTDKIEG